MINKFMVTVLGVRTGEKTAKSLFEKLALVSKQHSLFLQAFNPDSIVSERHLEHAFELASCSFEAKTNIARSLEAELLLRAAGTEKIDRAIEMVGVKDPARIILFSDSKIPGSLLKELGKEDKALLKLTEDKKRRIAKLFGIYESELELYSLESLVLEKIALTGF